VFIFYFKKHILEICDFKMKIAYSLLFSFRYRPTSALVVHKHRDFNANVMIWIIRTKEL